MKSFVSSYENGYLGLVQAEIHVGFLSHVTGECLFMVCPGSFLVLCILPQSIFCPCPACILCPLPLCCFRALLCLHGAFRLCHFWCLLSAGFHQDSVNSWQAGASQLCLALCVLCTWQGEGCDDLMPDVRSITVRNHFERVKSQSRCMRTI